VAQPLEKFMADFVRIVLIALDLAPITTRADEEHPPTDRSATKALPEKKQNLSQHGSRK